MIFTSQIFLFWFLGAVLVLYYLTPFRAKSLLLALVSYVFYGWWRVDFVALMLFSTVIDYFCGRGIGAATERMDAATEAGGDTSKHQSKRKLLLLVSICVNLGLLGYFKYFNFGIDTLNELLGRTGDDAFRWTKIVLPVGISFYTF